MAAPTAVGEGEPVGEADRRSGPPRGGRRKRLAR